MTSRKCCICSGLEGIRLFEEDWPVVGIGLVHIGIRICAGCGFVLQDPVIQPEMLKQYYTQTSNYTNPGRSGRPSRPKVEAVDRQLGMLDGLTKTRRSAIQIGCSDGYTLHRLREQGWTVRGVDPSPEASRLAANLWQVDVDVGFFEDWSNDLSDKYDLIVLTHILEHLYDPVGVLRKARELLEQRGLLLIEIPVLERPDRWPPGYFTVEHLNYFARATLNRCLSQAGLSAESRDFLITTEAVEYPILTCIARPFLERGHVPAHPDTEERDTLTSVTEYSKRETKAWADLDSRLRAATAQLEHIVVWGAGIHTSQLLLRTGLERYTRIDYLADSDSSKWGLQLGGYDVRNPDKINYADPTLGIVVSSFDSELEILGSLTSRSPRAAVIPLYNEI